MDRYKNTTVIAHLHNLDYEILSYPSGIRDTRMIAQKLGITADILFKSIVILIEKLPYLFVIPSNKELQLDLVREMLDKSDVAIATREQAQLLTKMKAGGISPLGLIDRNIPVYFDKSIHNLTTAYLSAGQRGFVLKMEAADLLTLLKPKVIQLDLNDRS